MASWLASTKQPPTSSGPYWRPPCSRTAVASQPASPDLLELLARTSSAASLQQLPELLQGDGLFTAAQPLFQPAQERAVVPRHQGFAGRCGPQRSRCLSQPSGFQECSGGRQHRGRRAGAGGRARVGSPILMWAPALTPCGRRFVFAAVTRSVPHGVSVLGARRCRRRRRLPATTCQPPTAPGGRGRGGDHSGGSDFRLPGCRARPDVATEPSSGFHLLTTA